MEESEAKKRSNRKKIKKALIESACFLAAGLIVTLLSRNVSGFSEWYAGHIFPAFPDTLGRLMSLFPFSVFEILIYALAVLTALYALYFLIIVIVPWWRGYVKRAASRALCFILLLATFCFMMMSLTCTVNYSRETFANLTDRQMTMAKKDGLFELCGLLITHLSELSEELSADGSAPLSLSGVDLHKEAREAMKRLSQDEKVLSGFYPNPKPVISSKWMSYLNITGIYSPFTMEANYNNDIPDHYIPYIICHELAHLRGFIREDEAGFIAYLACRKSKSAEFRYSGAINALTHALNAYRKEASVEEYAELLSTLPAQVARDFWVGRTYWKQFEGKVAEAATMANDSYLKANAQEDGVKSYGRMVGLLLAEYRIGDL